MYSVQTFAGGQAFENAFADVVCSNGWVACLSDGDEFTVDSVQDNRGIYTAQHRECLSLILPLYLDTLHFSWWMHIRMCCC